MGNLDPREARPLTSREIAKVISAVLFGFATWCDVKDIESAIDHFSQHSETYKEMIRSMVKVNQELGIK